MPTLRESQNFFFHLMARPEVIGQLRKNRAKTLRHFFRTKEDRAALMKPGIERFQTYRDHVSVGLLGQIEFAFPVLRSLVSRSEWNDLLNGFYLKRLTRSPIARHVFREFSLYLQKRYRGPLLKRLPYLKELAEYENLDLKLLYETDVPTPKGLIQDWTEEEAKSPGTLLRLVPLLNPHHALRVYRWPVHRICRGYASPAKVRPGRTVLVVYRDLESLKIRFLEANSLVADLIGRMEPGRKTMGTILKRLLKTQRPADPATFAREAIAAVESLRDKGVVLGYRKT